MTDLNKEDNLENIKQYFLENTVLLEKLLDLVNLMSKNNPENGYLQTCETKEVFQTASEEEKEKPWHCYLCGHSFRTHDNTNPDPPNKCQKCGRLDFRKPDKVGTHDPNCPRCKKKLAKMLALYEKLQVKTK